MNSDKVFSYNSFINPIRKLRRDFPPFSPSLNKSTNVKTFDKDSRITKDNYDEKHAQHFLSPPTTCKSHSTECSGLSNSPKLQTYSSTLLSMNLIQKVSLKESQLFQGRSHMISGNEVNKA